MIKHDFVNMSPKNVSGQKGKPLVHLMTVLIIFLISFSAFSCATTPPNTPPPQKSNKELALTKRNIGEAYILQGNYTAALKELLGAEKMNPDDAITHNYLGIAYNNKQLPDKAIYHFEKALDLNPGYSIAKNNLGATYLDQENWDAAIKCFNDVLTDILYTTPHFPLSNLGWAYYNKKDYPKARAYYMKALESKPHLIIALNGLGQTYMAERSYQEAAETFEKIVQLQDRMPQFYFQLAKAYELAGKKEKALKAYRKVIELAPSSEMAKEAKGRIPKSQ